MAIRLSAEEEALEATHEINVTPFIDVVLVLLIIFMVAAPLSTVDVMCPAGAASRQAVVSDGEVGPVLGARRSTCRQK
jgi:biopolymer transport protein ExbD